MADSNGGNDYKQKVLQLWTASLVIASLFLVATAIQTLHSSEESSIRRESYLANLEQFYQQEIQECVVAPQVDADGNPTSAGGQDPACIERVNDEGRYAQLLQKWGGDDLLVTGDEQ